ncbi:hypothetical protein GGQ96_003563, partial [Sphingomonas abaci]|nr:hypothetical protein [Sphingomonas abaci]
MIRQGAMPPKKGAILALGIPVGIVVAFLGAPQGLSYGQRQSEQMVNKSLSVAAKYIKFR